MALKNAKLHLVLDRDNGTMSVAADSTRIFIRDENISLIVDGWTLDEVTKTQSKTPYEPYFRIANFDGSLLAEAKLEPDATPTPLESGDYAMHGTLSTNTKPIVDAFSGMFGEVNLYFNASIYSTTSANPIATGDVDVWTFGGDSGDLPDLPSGSSEIADIRTALNAHKARVDNPHAVTAQQVGAMTRSDCDASYAAISAFQQLQQAVATAQTAIQGLTLAIAAANTAIQNNSNAINTKADASTTYRKNEVYTKGEVDQFVTNLRITPLMGKNFRFKTQNETRSALATVIQLFGGVVNGNWDVIHEAATPMPYIPMSAAGHVGTVKLKAVKVDGELTSEVTEA